MNTIKMTLPSLLCFTIIAAMLALSVAVPLLSDQPDLEGSGQASGSGEPTDIVNAAAVTDEEEIATTVVAPSDYDCTEASSGDYLGTHLGYLIRGIRTITAYSEYTNREWRLRGGDYVEQCRSNIRVRNAMEYEPLPGFYSQQNLANTVAIFEAYIEIATLAIQQETNVTVQEHLTIIHDILVAVVRDYKKVLSPFFCDCEAGETSSCFDIPELSSDLVSACNPSTFIFYNFYGNEALIARRELRNWRMQEHLLPTAVSQDEWIRTHIDSTSSAMTLL